MLTNFWYNFVVKAFGGGESMPMYRFKCSECDNEI